MFAYGPKGNLVLEVDGPTGVALQRGLDFSPDTKKVYHLAFQTCLPRGCRALFVVPDELKGELEKSEKGTIAVYALNGQAVEALTTLSGLTEGLTALGKRRPVTQ
jgi:invasion protein IalB